MKLLPDVLLDPMRRSLRAALVSATACLALAPQAAGAADYIEPGAPSILPAPALSLAPEAGTFQFHLGAAGVFFHPESDFTLLGFPLPGADTDLSSNLTGSLEIEYFLSPNFSLAATVGIPPETDADGTGLLAPAGRLDKIHYGLGAATSTAPSAPSCRSARTTCSRPISACSPASPRPSWTRRARGPSSSRRSWRRSTSTRPSCRPV